MVSRELRAVAEIEEINLASCSEGWHSWRSKHGGAIVAVVGERRQPQSCKSSQSCCWCGAEGQRTSECSGNEERKAFEQGAFPKFANGAANHLLSTV